MMFRITESVKRNTLISYGPSFNQSSAGHQGRVNQRGVERRCGGGWRALGHCNANQRMTNDILIIFITQHSQMLTQLTRDRLRRSAIRRACISTYLCCAVALAATLTGCSKPTPMEVGQENFLTTLSRDRGMKNVRAWECNSERTVSDRGGPTVLVCRFLRHGGYVNWVEVECPTTEHAECSLTGRMPPLGETSPTR